MSLDILGFQLNQPDDMRKAWDVLLAPDESVVDLNGYSPRMCIIRGLFLGQPLMIENDEEYPAIQDQIVENLLDSTAQGLAKYGFAVLSISTTAPYRVSYSGSHIDTPSIPTEPMPLRIRVWRGNRGGSLSSRSSNIKTRDFREHTYQATIPPADGVAFVSLGGSMGIPMSRHDFKRKITEEDIISTTDIILT